MVCTGMVARGEKRMGKPEEWHLSRAPNERCRGRCPRTTPVRMARPYPDGGNFSRTAGALGSACFFRREGPIENPDEAR